MCEFFEFIAAIWILPTFALLVIGIIFFAAMLSTEKSSSNYNFKIKNDSINHVCDSCSTKFEFYLKDLYQQFGNCGGYEADLFVECPQCKKENTPYTSK